VAEVGTSKKSQGYKGSTISLQAEVYLGHMLQALMTKKATPTAANDTCFLLLTKLISEINSYRRTT
jgi:hypothetical protein